MRPSRYLIARALGGLPVPPWMFSRAATLHAVTFPAAVTMFAAPRANDYKRVASLTSSAVNMTSDTQQPLSPTGTPFVGRERELTLLRGALAETIAGSGRVVLVCGEPGIGKTRLAEELASHAPAQGAVVRWGRCREGTGTPAFWPWVQILRAQIGEIDPEAVREQLGAAAAEIVRLIPELHEHLGVPAAPLAEDEGARFRLFDSVIAFLRASAARQPLVLVLEDLHWAQPASVELLRVLIDELHESRILVIATYRDIEVNEGHPLTAVLQAPSYPPQVQRIALAGLGEQEIGQLIAALGHANSASLAASVHSQSGGNPFFAGEIVRGLGTGEARIPSSVRDAIGHRLQRLSERCRRLVGLASVIGAEFEFATLERVVPELGDGGSLLQVLSEAAGARIVVEIPGAGGPGYRFGHALIRDVLYTTLPLEERLRLHWQVATALETLGGPDRERGASVLAHHFSEAIAGCADGAPRQACIDKAVLYATEAGRQATVMCAHDEAAAHYERGLNVLEAWALHDRRQQCEVLLAMAEAQVQDGAKYAVRSKTFHRAAALARELRDPQLLARAALGMARRTWYDDAATPAHVALLEEALEAVGKQDSVVRARLLGCLVVARYLPDPRVHSVPLSAEELAIARRVGDPRTIGFGLFSRYLALTEPEQTEERVRLATEVRELGDQVGDVDLAMYGRLFRFNELLTLGQVTTAERELEEYARLADDLRLPYFRSRGVAVRVATVLLAGRFAEAERLARETLRLIHDAEEPLALSGYAKQLALIYWEQDRLSEIEGAILGAFNPPHDGSEIFGGVMRAWRHAEQGRVQEARSEIEHLRAPDLETMPRTRSWFFFATVLAELCTAIGDTARAATLYTLLEPYARYLILTTGPTCWGSVSLVLGQLAHTMGRWDDALRHLDDALAVHRRMPSPPWIANTQWTMAATLHARNDPGDRERAAVLLTEVLEVTERLGMRRLQRKAVALREQMNEPPSGPPLARGEEKGGLNAPEALNAAFREEGDYWVIGYKVPAFRLKDRLGLRYLSALLNDPGREFLAIDLVAAVQAGRGDSTPDEPPRRVTAGACEPPLDQQAHREYAQRLRDLRVVVEEANAFNDRERAGRAQAEIDLLTDELRRGMGLGRRVRPSGAPAERARASVTHAIKAALRAITEHDPALGQYLAATIKTGTFCSYRPDPRVAMVWV